MSSHPEIDKLSAVHEKSQAIGDFLDWMFHTKKVFFAEYQTVNPHTQEFVTNREDVPEEQQDELEEIIFPKLIKIEDILAEYFDIDLKKIEEEKQQILKEVREKNNLGRAEIEDKMRAFAETL